MSKENTFSKEAMNNSLLRQSVSSATVRKTINSEQENRVDYKPGRSEGVWPSYFSSICVLLVMNIGTSAFVTAPKTAWTYSGFASFLPRMFSMFFCSFPIHIMESIVGQYTSKTFCVALSRMGPIFGCVAAYIVMNSIIDGVFYLDTAVWNIYYAYLSASAVVMKWDICTPHLSSPSCFSEELQKNCTKQNNSFVYYDLKCIPASVFCTRHNYNPWNSSHCLNLTAQQHGTIANRTSNETNQSFASINSVGHRQLAPLDFYNQYQNGQHSKHKTPQLQRERRNVFVIGTFVCLLLLSLPFFNLWVLSWLSIVVAVGSPTITLLLLFRVLTFDGAFDGIKMFFDMHAVRSIILNKSCWNQCMTNAMYCVDLGVGVIPSIRSRNPLRSKVIHSSATIVLWNLMYMLLNSILLFAIRGTLDKKYSDLKEQLKELDNDAGTLLFVVYTKIVKDMPNPQLFGTLYFTTILLNVLGTITVRAVSCGMMLCDALPFFNRRSFHWSALMAMTPGLLMGSLRCLAMAQGLEYTSEHYFGVQNVICFLLSAFVIGFKMIGHQRWMDVCEKLGLPTSIVFSRWLHFSVLVVGPIIFFVNLGFKITAWVPDTDYSWIVIACIAAQLSPILVFVVLLLGLWRKGVRGKAFWTTSAEFGADPRALLELDDASSGPSDSLSASKRQKESKRKLPPAWVIR